MNEALKRLVALSIALLASLTMGELLARLWKPVPFAPAVSLLPGGDELPLSEIMHFARRANTEGIGGGAPRAWAPANVDFRVRYDRPIWDYFDADGCIRVTHNSLGFRDREFAIEKAAGELRILTIGDSFTYGLGVGNDDAWPQLIEAELRAERAGGVEVINGGFATTASSPGGYGRWLRAEGVRFAPDVVVVGLCLNDLSRGVPMVAYAPPRREAFDGPLALVNAARHWAAHRREPDAPRDFTAVVEADPTLREETFAGLTEMRDLLAEHEVPLVVAIFPMLSGLRGEYPYQGLHEMVGAFCAKEGIACVDLLPAFLGRDERVLWAHPTDQHPNREGQRLIADGVRAFLREQGLL